MKKQDDASQKNTVLYGLAFDNEDNHKRITSGENFYILGGSEKTHEKLVEKILEFNQVVKKYGKQLHDLSESEYYAIVQEISAKDGKSCWFFNL